MLRFLLLSVLLICLATAAGCHPGLTSWDPFNGGPGRLFGLRLPNRDAIAKRLPPDVRLDTVAECEMGGHKKITVEDELIRVKAHIGEDGQLRDASGKPIQFFKLDGCWGCQPVNYQQILADQNRRLVELRKTHTVLTLTCNPTGIPIP